MMTFDESELLALLEEALGAPGPDEREAGTITTREVSESLGVSHYRAEKVLRQLLDEERVKRAMITRTDAWGTTKLVKGYRIMRVGTPDA